MMCDMLHVITLGIWALGLVKICDAQDRSVRSGEDDVKTMMCPVEGHRRDRSGGAGWVDLDLQFVNVHGPAVWQWSKSGYHVHGESEASREGRRGG